MWRDPGSTRSNPADQASDWRTALVDGRWSEFGGLPADLSEHELLVAQGLLDAARNRHSAVLSHLPVTFVEIAALRYWLHEGRVLLAELLDPPTSQPLAELLETLGDAERTSPGRQRRYGAMTTEYAYPARGLTLTVAESYDEPPAFAPSLAAVLLFRATDLVDYETRLGGLDHALPQF
jgi:hypothetical protein